MVRQGYASPIRAGYSLIGDQWAPLNRRTAHGQFTGLVTFRKADVESGYSQTTHAPQIAPGALVLADVPARLQSIGSVQTQDNGGQVVTTNRYRLSFEYSGDPKVEVGQVARFTSGVSLWLQGRPLAVTALLLSSLEWQHDIEVEANLG